MAATHASGHHHHSDMRNQGRVFWAMLLTGSFMIVDAVGGVLSGSLALLSDAGHMLTDFAALSLAWLAFRAGRRRGMVAALHRASENVFGISHATIQLERGRCADDHVAWPSVPQS